MLFLKPIPCKLDPVSSVVVRLINEIKITRFPQKAVPIGPPYMHTSELCLIMSTYCCPCKMMGTIYSKCCRTTKLHERKEAVRTKLKFIVVLLLWIEP